MRPHAKGYEDLRKATEGYENLRSIPKRNAKSDLSYMRLKSF